jgi:hypothetical protein
MNILKRNGKEIKNNFIAICSSNKRLFGYFIVLLDA